MNAELILGLLQNIAILLVISTLYEYLWLRNKISKQTSFKLLTGVFIGGIGIIIMMTPWKLYPGIIFDTRSVMLAVSGLFLGAIPTITAMVITALFRLYMGGGGMLMGITVIVLSGSVGLLWRHFRPDLINNKKYLWELLTLGLIVHILMLASTILLPKDQISDTLNNIFLPVLIVSSAGTVLLGSLMMRQRKNLQMEIAHKESERKLKEAQHLAHIGNWELEMTNNILYWSDEMYKIFEVDQGQFDKTYESFLELVHPEDRKKVNSAFRSSVQNKHFCNVTHRLTTKDGMIKYIAETCITEFNKSGQPIRSGGTAQDITERIKTEQELIKAKEKAEESDRLKSIFLSNMSHEIRTPMNAIMGFSELLGEPGLEEEQKLQYTNIIQNAGGRLLQIIDNIIDISKLEAQQLAYSPSECKMYEIFTDSIKTFKNSQLLTNKPDIKLILKYSPEYKDLTVKIDARRFQQVLDNLINNAIKYTNRGEVETGFTVRTKDDMKYLGVYVRDTGSGIPKEKFPIIFEHFRQAEEDSYHNGTGLGLSICKGIVELMGGEIWFTSTEKIGTTFYFNIPFIPIEKSNITWPLRPVLNA